jgi:hypothetical protein
MGLGTRTANVVAQMRERFNAHAKAEQIDETGPKFERAKVRLENCARSFALALRMGRRLDERLSALKGAALDFDDAERAYGAARVGKRGKP